MVPGADGELWVEGKDGVNLHLLAFRLASLVPFHCDRPRLQVDPGDDRRMDPAWKLEIKTIIIRFNYIGIQ